MYYMVWGAELWEGGEIAWLARWSGGDAAQFYGCGVSTGFRPGRWCQPESVKTPGTVYRI